MVVSWKKSRKRLATVWFIGSGLTFFIIFLMTLAGRDGGVMEKVWTWFLPTVVPTMSLIIGVLVMDSSGNPSKDKLVDSFVYRLSFGLSVAYLLSVALTVLYSPFSNVSLAALVDKSSLWLGPFQGLVTASLGAFFMQREKDSTPEQVSQGGVSSTQ